MELRTLSKTPFQDIVNCMLEAFSDYSLKMPEELNYWKTRWEIAAVDYNLSIGVFKNDQLKGLILNGVQTKENNKIAYNTLTGVVPEYRGQKLPKRIYEFLTPIFLENNVNHCILEVLDDNEKAIHVYKQIGFNIKRHLLCYKGKLNKNSYPKVILQKIDFDEYFNNNQDKKLYAWDFDKYALYNGRNKYLFYNVLVEDNRMGRFAIEIQKKYLAQFFCEKNLTQNYKYLFGGVSQLLPDINVINMDSSEIALNDTLKNFGLINHVSQYEMSMDL